MILCLGSLMVILVEFVGGVNAEFARGDIALDRMAENGECEWRKKLGEYEHEDEYEYEHEYEYEETEGQWQLLHNLY